VPRPPFRPRADRGGLALLLLVSLAAPAARADNAIIPDTPEQLGLRGAVDAGLQLQVFINGFDTRQIVPFERDSAGRLRAKRADLAAIGLKTGLGPADAWLAPDQLAGVSARYDETAQTLSLNVAQSALAPKSYSAAQSPAPGAPAASGWGAALNYDLYAGTDSWWAGQRLGFGTGSLTLDARAFSPLGVISQSAILGSTAFTTDTALRLDTSWRYDDDAHGVTYRAGDLINAGLPWTRPIRLGGLQVSHDFGLRPDLVTGPSATVSGTAAAPSTADVFVNNFKIFSSPVDAGPFRIDNLPAINGAGSATLVLHDVTGKETTQAAPFFVSSRLLRPGALDYSAEAGYARLNYGVDSFDYDPHLVGSASLRAGVADWVTLEGHAEGGDRLVNGGLGASFAAFQRVGFDVSLATSDWQGRLGGQVGLGVSTTLYGATFDASLQRSFKDYSDLAEVTAPPTTSSSVVSRVVGSNPLFADLLLSTSVAPPLALDRVSLGLPRVFGQLAANASFVNEVDRDGSIFRIASLGVSHNFTGGFSAFATAFADIAAKRDYGVIVGLSYTFGGGVTASTQSTLQGRAFTQTTGVVKSAGQEIGDYGYSLDDQEGGDRYSRASATYQSAVGRATATVNQYGAGPQASASASGEFAGSAAWLGSGYALAPHISDSFAMVDAGAAGVTVLEDNRPIGKTDSSGRLLLTDLRGFQDNKIAVDPTTLPAGADIGATELRLRPRAQSGVVADFKVRTDARSAEIALVDEAGQPLPVGSQVDAPGGQAIVGYDGRAYLTDLKPHNALNVRANGRNCVATFDLPASHKARPTIGPITCRVTAAHP